MLSLLRCDLALIDQIYRRQMLPLPDGNEKPLGGSIPREEGDYLYSLIRHLRPSLSIEVGMAHGLSTLFIAKGLRDNGHGRHIAIDPFQSSEWQNTAVGLVCDAGLDSLVELIETPSHQALPELERNGVRCQFVFIDGSHLFDYVMTDFLCSDRLLEVGGLLAFDDSDWPAVSQAIRFVLANRKYAAAFPEMIIDDPRIHPTLLGGLLRRAGKAVPQLGAKLRPDFMVLGNELGVAGRCVVLRKLGEDDRDSQSGFHRPF